MITEREQEQASLYALDALPTDERREFEQTLHSNAELKELVLSLQRATEALAHGAPVVAPPSSLRARILDRARPKALEKSATRSNPGFQFHGAADATGWKELPVKGAWVKVLSIEKERGYAVLLGKLGPGVRYPAHSHLGSEELYILTGDLQVGDRTLGPGDFHHSDPGTSHEENYSVDGCTLIAIVPSDHEMVTFATAAQD